MTLFWYLLAGGLLAAHFGLAGIDYGIGLALPWTGDRRAALNAIGPLFLGNEVWIVAAIGVLGAAFPRADGELFGAAYPLVVAVVLGLVAVSVGVQLRSRPAPGRRGGFDVLIALGSLTVALGLGLLLGNLLTGLPLTAPGAPAGPGAGTALLGWYPLLVGLAVAGLFAAHGATFLAWRRGPAEPRAVAVPAAVAPDAASGNRGVLARPGLVNGAGLVERAGLVDRAGRLCLVALGGLLAAAGGALVSAPVRHAVHQPAPALVGVVLIGAALVGALLAGRAGRLGLAVAGTGLAAALPVPLVGAALYPNLLVSTLDPAGTVSVAQAAAGDATLNLLATVAVPLVPLLIAAQALGWWIFRRRPGQELPQYW